MKPFILVLYCLSFLSTQAQQAQRATYSTSQQLNEADLTRREVRREALEEKKIVVNYQKDMKGDYDFYCENKTFCTYTVEVSFTEMENLRSDVPLPAIVEVMPGQRHIFTLIKTAGRVRLRYHYRSFKGCPNPKIDTGYTYLLPVAPGKETHIFELYYLDTKYSGESKPKDWYAIGIHMHAGDTVYAARRGKVTETSDNAVLPDSNYTFARDENYVEIAHNDCTFGKYTVFRDSGIFVHPGDWVEAGQPLGIAGGEKYTEGPQVRFSVRYHLEQDVLDSTGQRTGKTQDWAYVPLDFWTLGKGKIRLEPKKKYISEHPAEVITREMTKKEVRKWNETHKST